MKTTIRNITIIATVSTLTACGGSGTTATLDDPIGTLSDVSAECDTAFYKNIRGSYNGQVTFDSPPELSENSERCVWEVDLSVWTEIGSVGFCESAFEFESNLVSSTPNCADLSTTGQVLEGVGVLLDDPQWPLELSFRTPQVTDVFKYYAPGKVNVGGWEFIFDGSGNISADQVSELAGWSGTLVSFSDQPFRIDDGESLEVEDEVND